MIKKVSQVLYKHLSLSYPGLIEILVAVNITMAEGGVSLVQNYGQFFAFFAPNMYIYINQFDLIKIMNI